jgi:alanine racemase
MVTKRNKKSVLNKTRKNTLLEIPYSDKDITATIDANAIRHNIDYLRKKTSLDVMPVIKANAYGHGIIEMSKILRKHGVKHIGVATLGEAILLRNSGDKGDIVAWLYNINGPEVKQAILDGITISIIDEKDIPIISKLTPKNKVTNVHIFVDTGIDRAAIPYNKSVDAAIAITKDPKLKLVGMMSHLIQSEKKNDPTTLEQLKKFRNLRENLIKNHNINIPLVHIANSGGCLNYDVSDFTLARPGLAIYGIDPSGKYNKNLKPAMTITSIIMQLKYIPKGYDIGYDRKYITKKEMRVCVVPVGYADFLPRSGSGKTYVYINGSKRKVLGNISMDQIVVEAKPVDKVGDTVLFFGDPHKGAKQSVYDIAKYSNTITDEVLSRTNYRVNLKYINL